MTNPLEALFGAGLLPKTDFPPQSRYHGIGVRVLEPAPDRPDDEPVAYLARRWVPSPERFATLSAYRTVEGERLDRIAARLVGDSEAFWQLCDANGVVWPTDLEQPETVVRTTLPADVPAPEPGA
jgi:hypothetical protein